MDLSPSKDQKALLSFNKSSLMLIFRKFLSCPILRQNLKAMNTLSPDLGILARTDFKLLEMDLRLSKSHNDSLKTQFYNGQDLDPEIPWDWKQDFVSTVMIWPQKSLHLKPLSCGLSSRERMTQKDSNLSDRRLWRSSKKRSRPNKSQSKKELDSSLRSQESSDRTVKSMTETARKSVTHQAAATVHHWRNQSAWLMLTKSSPNKAPNWLQSKEAKITKLVLSRCHLFHQAITRDGRTFDLFLFHFEIF